MRCTVAGFRLHAPERPRPWLHFRGLVEPKVRLDHLPAHDSVRVALQILRHIQRSILDALSRFRRGYVKSVSCLMTKQAVEKTV